IFEYLALTSLVLLGSTISILTAIHMSALTHSTLMKTLDPRAKFCHSSICYSSMQKQDLIYSRQFKSSAEGILNSL
ncbi:unnamed protein product, partial [Rotaria sp. Silwood1]